MDHRKEMKLQQFAGNASTSLAPRVNTPAQMQQGYAHTNDFAVCDNNDSFARQDSLAMCTQLLVQEGANTYDDMEDLTKYLTEGDDGYDDYEGEPLEPMLEKQAAIYSDISAQHGLGLDYSPHYATLANYDNPMDASNHLDEGYAHTQQMFGFQLKKEENEWEEEQEMDALVPGPSRMSSSTDTIELPGSETEVSMKPRKYNLKPESVKKTSKYLDARKRNNIAVRKSRNKQKKIQEEKNRTLKSMEMTVKDLEDRLQKEGLRYVTLEKKYDELNERYKKTIRENEHLRNVMGSRGGQFAYRQK